MKALVTGCAGFIGSHIVDRLLQDGFDVVGIDCFTDYYSKALKEFNISQALKNKNFKLINKNILELEKYPEVDYVFHLAAQPGVRTSWGENFEIYVKNNIQATQKLLEYYKDKNISKFVYSSSSSVYGNVSLPMKEDLMLKPVSPYGVTKLAAENLCQLYTHNYGLPSVSLRYFTVYGPRIRPDLAITKFVKSISNGEPINIFGDGTQTRDFTYVNDVVEANMLAAQSEYAGEVFNIGGGSRVSVNELIQKIENILSKKAIKNYEEKQKGDVENTWADTSKARKLLNWMPRTNIDNGLIEYIGSIMSLVDTPDANYLCNPAYVPLLVPGKS